MKTKQSKLFVDFLILLGIIIIVAVVGFLILEPSEDVIQGQVEATEVRISGKLPGRIEKFFVEEGQSVKAGDTLAALDSPEIQAKLLQAEAAKNAATAQNRKAIKGARSEQIESAYEMWQKANAGLEIAQKTFNRIQNLYSKGVVTAQKKDEAEANLNSMQATAKAAYSQYMMAKNGTELEDKIAASALVDKAKGAIAEVESYITETHLIAPLNGIISEIFPQKGELVGTGAPIMNILNLDDSYMLFNIREDLLKEYTVGKKIQGYIPALDKSVSMKIVSMKDMGSYAAWRATKTKGEFDLRTFQVKAKPTETLENLRPGMTVVIKK